MMDWLEENGGTIVVIAIIVFFGWLLMSNSSNNSSSSESSDSYESFTDDGHYEEESEPLEEFHGYECSDDCSGHNAGYEWADENGVCDQDFYGGNSESFAEGVRIYAEENC